jgi:hypothetical protein
MKVRKPLGWPKLMIAKRLKHGAIAYYWDIPTWAKAKGCSMKSEALGSDYSAAKARCDSALNPQFDDWRTGTGSKPSLPSSTTGSFDWMVAIYKRTPQYGERSVGYKRDIDKLLTLASKHPLKDGRCFGALNLSSISPGAADLLYSKLRIKPDGSERTRTAMGVMIAVKRAWSVAYRSQPTIVPAANPFSKMEISYSAKRTRAVTYLELLKFVEAADRAGMASIGTSALIAFHWLQRQVDILTRLSWSHYKPADAPHCVRIFHHKTKVLYDLPLYDDDGTPLYPELMARLDSTPRLSTLIITRETVDRTRKTHLPWRADYFRHNIAKIRELAGIDKNVKFMGIRHGGNVEGANAGLTEAQLRSLSGHKNAGTMIRYAQETPEQQREGARKRLNLRTKKGNLSE